ncbi:MAG: 30S ribosomal protein S20 [Patescibacteria group bacterium]
MPVTKQAIKKVRQDRRKTATNAIVKKAYKKAVVEARKSATSANLAKAFSALDRAAKVNIIHKNKAGRLKSRLSKKVKGDASQSTKPATSKAAAPKAKKSKKQ